MVDFLVLMIGSGVALIAALAAVFLPRFRIGEVPLAPAETLGRLAYALRFARFMVTEAPDHLKVRVGSWTMVEVFATPWDRGTRLSYRAGATTGAWSAIIVLFIAFGIPYITLFGVPVVVTLFLMARSFVRRRIVSLLASLPAPPPPGEADEIRSALVQGLSEGHRLATEAYETERSAYHDWELLVVLVAIVVWAFVLIGLFTSSSDPDFARRAWGSAQLALAAAVATGLALGYAVHLAFRARLRDLRDWARRLYTQLEAETAGPPSKTAEPSAFELLAEASRRVPQWVGIRRDRFFQRDPGAAIILVIVVYWGLFVLATGSFLIWTSPPLGGLLLLAGAGLAAGAYVAFQRWRRALVEDAARELDSWSRRLEGLRSRAEEFLREL